MLISRLKPIYMAYRIVTHIVLHCGTYLLFTLCDKAGICSGLCLAVNIPYCVLATMYRLSLLLDNVYCMLLLRQYSIDAETLICYRLINNKTILAIHHD